jgi:8-oxo-dGTP pyrophosphatase MutT (NUDIX family)
MKIRLLSGQQQREWETVMTAPKILMNWDVRVYGISGKGLMQRDNRILLCMVEDADWWFLPGGGVHMYETSHQALKREFLEETGFEIEIQRLVWIIENFFVHENMKYHYIEFTFMVFPIKRNGKWMKDEFIGKEDFDGEHKSENLVFKWFERLELDEINLLPAVLKDLLKNNPEHPVHIIHHDENWDSL